MRVATTFWTVMLAIAACTAWAVAEEPKGATEDEGFGVVVSERFQDLDLTGQQEAKIAEIRRQYQPEIFSAAEDLAMNLQEEFHKVRSVLTPEQVDTLQRMKASKQMKPAECLAERLAFLDDLHLTDAERAKIQAIREQYRPQLMNTIKQMQGLLSSQQKKAREAGLQAGKSRREILASLNLTAEQKSKVQALGKEMKTEFGKQLTAIKNVLTPEQQGRVAAAERKENVRDRFVYWLQHEPSLILTSAQKSKIADIRKEYQPKIEQAGNKLRTAVREQLAAIAAELKT